MLCPVCKTCLCASSEGPTITAKYGAHLTPRACPGEGGSGARQDANRRGLACVCRLDWRRVWRCGAGASPRRHSRSKFTRVTNICMAQYVPKNNSRSFCVRVCLRADRVLIALERSGSRMCGQLKLPARSDSEVLVMGPSSHTCMPSRSTVGLQVVEPWRATLRRATLYVRFAGDYDCRCVLVSLRRAPHRASPRSQ